MQSGFTKGLAIAIALVLMVYFFAGDLFGDEAQQAATGDWREIISE